MTGFGNPNDEQNPPVPLQGHGECAVGSRESGAADCGQNFPSRNTSAEFSFPYVSPANPSWQNMHATHQSYPNDPRTANHLMTGLVGPNTLQNLQILSNLRGSLRNIDVCSGGFQNSQANVNFTQTGSKAAGGYQMNVLGGEADGSNINWSQTRESSSNLGCGTPVSNQNTSCLETGVRNDVKVNAFHPRKVDGSFLSLRTGGDPEARAKSKFDPREIASKLVEAVGPQTSGSHIQPATSLSSFQSYSGCFPSTVSNLGGWPASNNDDGATQDAIVGLSSNPYLSPQISETLKQYDFFENNAKNTGFVDQSVGRNPVIGFQGVPSPPSLPFNSTYSCLPHPGKQSELASEAFQPAWVSTQPTRNLLSITPGNASSLGSHCSRLRDSSVPQDYLGISMFPSESSTTQAVESGHWDTSVQPDGHLSSAFEVHSAQPFGSSNNPKKTSLVIAEGSGNKPATRAPFPRRLGVQIDDAAANQSASGSLLPTNMGVQAKGNEHQSRNSGPVQLTRNFLGPISGHRQYPSAGQFKFQRPSLSTGSCNQILLAERNLSTLLGIVTYMKYSCFPFCELGQPQHGIPAQFPKDLMRVDQTTGQLLPKPKAGRPSHVHSVISQPSLKRRANEAPSMPSWGKRKRLVTTGQHSAAGIPTVLPPTPTFHHIKWTGCESPPQPTGQRCMICKRDLLFTPEGPFYQPTVPPAVAVLPCGHTFHDQCLENITPKDQSEDPPCIPCAVGET